MKEEILRIYWQVYTDGMRCLKNWMYQDIFVDAWNFFKTHCDPVNDAEWWDKLVEDIKIPLQKYHETALVKHLFVDVTLEEIERIYKEGRKHA